MAEPASEAARKRGCTCPAHYVIHRDCPLHQDLYDDCEDEDDWPNEEDDDAES